MNGFSDSKEFKDLVLSLPDFDNHREVVLVQDEETGLQALLAVHNLSRGPGTGGTRIWNYSSFEHAVTDVLRLSEGMTYKNAMAELPFGGGKAVILSPGKIKDRRALMLAFGRAVNSLEGRYYTAEDVGTTTADMGVVSENTRYIFGLTDTSGDPSPHTARGVLMGIEEGVREKLGVDELRGIRVMVQGVGNVGYHLCRLLHKSGAEILVSDINREAVARCEQEFGAKVVAPNEVFRPEVEVYSPCALGATVNEKSFSELKCQVISGAANNQLQSNAMAVLLAEKGILYAPDYVINAGGIINIACEFSQAYDSEIAAEKVGGIRTRIKEVFHRARLQNKTTVEIAAEMARRRFEKGSETNIELKQLAPVNDVAAGSIA